MSVLYPITLDDMINEVARELYHRRQVNARLVGSSLADRRYEVMDAVLTKLKREKARVTTAQPESTQESTPTEAAP